MPEVSHTMQFILYCVFSNLLALVVLIPRLESSPDFYVVGVTMAEGVSTLVMANWLISMAIVIGKLFQVLLFGDLRLIEIEHIYENSKFTVLNSLIALSMFSNDFLLIPGILTLFLLFMKVFHWILKDRFDYLFQNATTPRAIIVTRNTLTLMLLIYFDFHLVYSCVEYSFGNNPDVYFAFGLEFAILFLDLLLLGGKVILNTMELIYLSGRPGEDVMESKAMFIKYLEIAHSCLILCIHLFMLFTLMGPYRVPIYLFKDIFFNTFSLVKQITALRRYQKASRELDTKLSDATEEDLNEDNNLCIICRDDMTTIGPQKGERMFPKKLKCGHIIHLGCLKSWCERSQVCPMCRAPVFGAPQQESQPPQQGQEQNQNQHQNQQYPLQADNIRAGETSALQIENIPLPHSSGFSTSQQLRLRSNALIPPDWTLMKLTNGSAMNDHYQLPLNGTIIAQVKQITNLKAQTAEIMSELPDDTKSKYDERTVEHLKQEIQELRTQIESLKPSATKSYNKELED